MGQTWQAFGLVPTYGGNLLSFDMLAPMMKGSRQPQIIINTQINKNWAYMVGLMSPTTSGSYGTTLPGQLLISGTPNGASNVNQYTRNGMPFAEGEITFTSDACGKIGPWQMLFGFGGFYGQVKQSAAYLTNTVPAVQKFTDDTSPTWAAIFKTFIPIIPEKKGNKTGALALSGTMFTGQNWSWMGGPYPFGISGNLPGTNSDYTTGGNGYLRSASPTMYGFWGQATYFLADNLFVNGYWGYIQANISDTYRAGFINGAPPVAVGSNVAGAVRNVQHIAANIMYDVNPALRVGFEWANVYARYAQYAVDATSGQPLGTKGTNNSFRIGAFYFF
jgi:hypothetical protein